MKFNPWHDVSIGDKAPEVVEAIIEIPKRSKAKYELDKDSGMLRLDRVLFSSVHYPENYGFIPKTYGDDKDPLDIIVFCQEAIQPMCLVSAKVIGVMRMIDGGEGDDKILAVANDDESVNHINSIEEMPKHIKDELMNFFEYYKTLENKSVEVEGIQGRDKAIEIMNEAIKAYEEKFGQE